MSTVGQRSRIADQNGGSVCGVATKDMLASLDPAAAQDALRGLRVTLTGHSTRDGVLFGARTWIITARTPRRQHGRAPDIEDLHRIAPERGNLGPPPYAE